MKAFKVKRIFIHMDTNRYSIYVTSIDLFCSTMDMDRKYKSSSLFSIANHARIFSVQLAYGLSLQDVKHNLNILWMIAQMAFEAKIIRLITKSPGFSVYLCIMNINIKQCMYVKSQKKNRA